MKAIEANSLTLCEENLVAVNRLIKLLREDGVRAFQERVMFERGGFVSQGDLCERQIVTCCFVIRVKFIGLFNSRSTPNPTIDFYRFATGQVTNLLSIERSKTDGFGGWLSVSPDGQWVIYVQTDQVENDIMLVENFR